MLDFMGNTPFVKIQKLLAKSSADVYIKLEEFNPGGSIKSRVAYKMILEAEKNGMLTPNSGQTLIEATGGNTGIGMAIAAAIKGYKVVFVVPDNFSKEKIKILQIYGARVILSDSTTGNDSHVRKAREMLLTNPDYIMLDQFSNPANPYAHYSETGQEILDVLPNIDAFVAGIGSGGTISGVGKKIKNHFPNAQIIGVQPEGCDVLKGKAVPHKILAIALGIIPKTLDVNIVDRVVSVQFQEVIELLRQLARQEGILVGISSGANILAATKIAAELGEGKVVVTIAPDSGRSYIEAIAVE